MPKFEVPEALQQMGVEINDPNVPGFFNKFAKNVPSLNHPMFKPPTLKAIITSKNVFIFENFRIIHYTKIKKLICLREIDLLPTVLIKHVR